MGPTCIISIHHCDTNACIASLLVHLSSPLPIEKWKEMIDHFQCHLVHSFPRPTFVNSVLASLQDLFRPHGTVRAEYIHEVDFTHWGDIPSIFFTFDKEVINLMDDQFIEKVMYHV